jgi:hypothetical protein
LSDHDFCSTVEVERRRTISLLYGCLGCSAECGGRTPTLARANLEERRREVTLP